MKYKKYSIYILSSLFISYEILWVIDNTITNDYYDEVNVESIIKKNKPNDSCIITTAPFSNLFLLRNSGIHTGESKYVIIGNKNLCEDLWNKEDLIRISVCYSKIFNFSRYVEIEKPKSSNIYYTPHVSDHIFFAINTLIILLLILSFFNFNKYYSDNKLYVLFPLYVYLTISIYLIFSNFIHFRITENKIYFYIE